jgi:hypothetical protein
MVGGGLDLAQSRQGPDARHERTVRQGPGAHSALRSSRFCLAEFDLLFLVPVNLDHDREGARSGSDLRTYLHEGIRDDFRLLLPDDPRHRLGELDRTSKACSVTVIRSSCFARRSKLTRTSVRSSLWAKCRGLSVLISIGRKRFGTRLPTDLA